MFTLASRLSGVLRGISADDTGKLTGGGLNDPGDLGRGRHKQAHDLATQFIQRRQGGEGFHARSIQRRPEIECVYVLDHRGQQVTETIFNTHEIPPQSLLFRPAEIGTDHSLKVYYNQLIDSELSHYITDPYVSMASGQLCQTLSSMFRDGSNERMFVLCVDVKAGAKAAA